MAVEIAILKSDNFFIGEDKTFTFNVVDSNNTAQVMTGWALEFVLRTSPAATTATLTKTTGGSGITIQNGDGTNDQAVVVVADSDTVNLQPGSYHFTLRRTDSGYEQVLAFGPVSLQQADTR